MRVHLVGGFLGSGKTTSIIAACKILAGRGMRVGVITNDQGKYLVDTAFVRAEALPAVEVSGGCFCCRFPDFRRMIRDIDASAHPDQVFAESVGSCADLVATVVRPSELELSEGVSSFSVFADVRLLGHWLKGGALPFAEEVVYLFGKQLEEAGLLVINKADLVSTDEGAAVRRALERRFPEKPVLLQSALSGADVEQWTDRLVAPVNARAGRLGVLDLDYRRYAAAEASLAWLDAEVQISAGRSATREVIRQIAVELVSRARTNRHAIGHLKLLVVWDGGAHEIGITASDTSLDLALPDFGSKAVELVVNARVQCSPEELTVMVDDSLDEVSRRFGRSCSVTREESFRPSYPSPTYRIAE